MRAVALVIGLNIADAIQRMDLDDVQLSVTVGIIAVLFVMDVADWLKGLSK